MPVEFFLIVLNAICPSDQHTIGNNARQKKCSVESQWRKIFRSESILLCKRFVIFAARKLLSAIRLQALYYTAANAKRRNIMRSNLFKQCEHLTAVFANQCLISLWKRLKTKKTHLIRPWSCINQIFFVFFLLEVSRKKCHLISHCTVVGK